MFEAGFLSNKSVYTEGSVLPAEYESSPRPHVFGTRTRRSARARRRVVVKATGRWGIRVYRAAYVINDQLAYTRSVLARGKRPDPGQGGPSRLDGTPRTGQRGAGARGLAIRRGTLARDDRSAGVFDGGSCGLAVEKPITRSS